MPQTTGAPVLPSSQLAKPMAACRRIAASPADRCLAAIVKALAKDGYRVSVPSWDGDAYLRISNARQAVTDLTITPQCDITWEYRSVRYPHASERGLTDVATELLDPGQPAPALPGDDHHLTPLGAIRHALTRHGLTATITRPRTGTGPLLTVTNPAQPCRGTILITSDGELTWTINTPHHPDGGIPLHDIATAISRALDRAQHLAISTQQEQPA